MPDYPRGAQFDASRLKTFEHFIGVVAPLGADTPLAPFGVKLKDKPYNTHAIWCMVGVTGQGGYMQRRGVDWDINLTTGAITWLSTARQALDATKWISFSYWPNGGGTVNALSWLGS
jgi:hypothetical protein